jgi:septum formation protein
MYQTTAPLYLASGSSTRRGQLQACHIPFSLVHQDADESQISLEQPLERVVCALAALKMAHVQYPLAAEGESAFFLTADTMTLDSFGCYFGKPRDRREAVQFLKSLRLGATIGSGFCVDKAVFKAGKWLQLARTIGYDEAFCVVDIPDEFLDFYLDRVPYTSVAGGVTIEGFGEQFVKEVRGNYSAILGLPMYKLRVALAEMGFFLVA